MKKLFPLIVVISLISCQKEVLTPSSINTQVSSDAKSDTKGQIDLSLEFSTFNECTNEWVLVTMNVEYKYNYFVTSGDYHAKTNYQIKDGWGIGQTSGNTYKLVGQVLHIEKMKDYATTENQTFRVTSKLTFINPNGSDWVNESIRLRRILDDGTIVVDVEEETSYCR